MSTTEEKPVTQAPESKPDSKGVVKPSATRASGRPMRTVYEHVVDGGKPHQFTDEQMHWTRVPKDQDARLDHFEALGYLPYEDHPGSNRTTIMYGIPKAIKEERYRLAMAKAKAAGKPKAMEERLRSSNNEFKTSSVAHSRRATLDQIADRLPAKAAEDGDDDQ